MKLGQFTRWRPGKPELIVVFNSYVSLLGGAPSLEHETKLELFSLSNKYNASFVWYAEDTRVWYLAHEHAIAEALRVRVDILLEEREHADQRVKVVFVGMSSGGYAAIRQCVQLAAMYSYKPVDIMAYPMNAQTGFSQGLLHEIIKVSRHSSHPDFSCFGTDPIFLDSADNRLLSDYKKLERQRGHIELDLKNFMASIDICNEDKELISLHYDRLNPIEEIFAKELLHFPCVRPMPADWGLRHSHGVHRFGVNFIEQNLLSAFEGVCIADHSLEWRNGDIVLDLLEPDKDYLQCSP
jgi:hypothetical protein